MLPLLRENIPEHWRKLYALAAVLSTGPVLLKRASEVWERWYDAHDLNPHLDPKNLGRMLREVGVDREGQTAIFKPLAMEGEALAYDLSMLYSQSGEISMAENGHKDQAGGSGPITESAILNLCRTAGEEPRRGRHEVCDGPEKEGGPESGFEKKGVALAWNTSVALTTRIGIVCGPMQRPDPPLSDVFPSAIISTGPALR